jgi:hypothetical protein
LKRHAILLLGVPGLPAIVQQTGHFEIPKNLASSIMEGGISLPNASLCADFLVLPSREIVGVCVAVSNEDLPLIRSLFEGALSSRVAIRESGETMPSRYLPYSAWNWLEVTWTDPSDAALAEAQSNQVLWYLGSSQHRHVGAMVLEDLDYIEGEADGLFVFGQTPESPLFGPRG